VFSLLLSGRLATALKLLSDSQTDQDVVVNVPHPSGVKFLFCKLLYLLDFDQICVIRAKSGPVCDFALCNCLSVRSIRSFRLETNLLQIGDMMAFCAPEAPERFVTCNF
jgi:hypothetical protein